MKEHPELTGLGAQAASADLVYLDNAATTFPKPREVLNEMVDAYARIGASPGRGAYDLATEATDYVTGVRRRVAGFFGAPDPERVIFAANATDALNLAIQGVVCSGSAAHSRGRRGARDHVVSTRLEHNSVLRPLFHLKERDEIDYDLVRFGVDGLVDPADIERAIRAETRLVVVCHGSQVLGTVQPVRDIALVCARHGVPLLIDAAQTAGQVPIDMAAWGVSAIAFTGHKGLLGPSGSGGLILGPDLDVRPTRYGGTGIDSHDLRHTEAFPSRLEAGTINMLGIIGLSMGIDYLEHLGMEDLHRQEMTLIRRLRDGLTVLPGVRICSPLPRDQDIPVLTCLVEGMEPEDVGAILDADYRVAVRTGLLCAPFVHADLGTAPRGAIRFSLGPGNTEHDVDRALEAVSAVARSRFAH